MSEQSPTSAAAQAIRDALGAADRRRRQRDASARIWHAAPRAAAGLLATAAVARWAVWPVAVPAAALAAVVIGFAGYAWVSRRRRPVSDAAAAAIDRDAGMGGELRSAGWFAARSASDPWADFHLERAAGRISSFDWSSLYPPAPASRARLVTAAMIVGVLALTATIPERIGVHPTAAAAGRADREPRKDVRGEVLALPPELQRQLEALLAATERGDLATAAALAQNAELREMLKRLSDQRDPDLLEALARAMASNQLSKTTAADLAALAERARRAADTSTMSDEMKDALDKLAKELEEAGAELAKDNAEAAATPGSQQGQGGKQSAQGGAQDLSIQFAKDADAGGGAGVMMMTPPNGEQSAGPPGSGVGGSGSEEAAAGSASAIEAALKEELVEASQDTPGANVDADIRRKTERGSAAVGFSQGAAAAFDRSRAAAPPPVPEARRTGVQTYFVRKPQ